MSENNGFKVIDKPMALNRNKYAGLAEKLKSLPDGQALEVKAYSPSNFAHQLKATGVKYSASKIGDGIYAVWEKRDITAQNQGK
jgi:hypothetical protein